LVETFKTNAFNAFVLDRVIGPFGTCNVSLLVFMGWSTSVSEDGEFAKKERFQSSSLIFGLIILFFCP
jgi:hypothetical protein